METVASCRRSARYVYPPASVMLAASRRVPVSEIGGRGFYDLVYDYSMYVTYHAYT